MWVSVNFGLVPNLQIGSLEPENESKKVTMFDRRLPLTILISDCYDTSATYGGINRPLQGFWRQLPKLGIFLCSTVIYTAL